MKFSGSSFSTDHHLQNKGIFVQHQKKGVDGDGNLHQHMGYEIYLFHKGRTTIIIGDQVYPLQSGDMLFIPGQIPHISSPDLEYPYIRTVINFLNSHVSMFPSSVLEPILTMFQNDGLLLHLDINEQQEIEKLVLKMEDELTKNDFGGETLASAFLLEILLIAYRKNRAKYNRTPYKHLTQREMYVEQILSIINSTFNEEINLDFISGLININKHYMCHCFKEITGYTISNYIQHKRMEEAKILLRLSNKTVTNIGQCVGIRNVAHFSRLFKEHCGGVTPSAYRKSIESIKYDNI